MIIYFINFLIFLILCFVLYLAVRALRRGLDAKNDNFNKKSKKLTKK